MCSALDTELSLAWAAGCGNLSWTEEGLGPRHLCAAHKKGKVGCGGVPEEGKTIEGNRVSTLTQPSPRFTAPKAAGPLGAPALPSS